MPKIEMILTALMAGAAVGTTAGSQRGKYQVDTREAKGVQVGDHNTQHNTFS